MAIMTADIRLIPRHEVTIRLCIRLCIVGYVHWGTQQTLRVHLLWKKIVFRLYLMAYSCDNFYIPASVQFGHLVGALFNLVFNNFCHWYCKGREVNFAARAVIGNVWLSRHLCTGRSNAV